MQRKTDFVLRSVGGENLLIPLASRVMDLNGLIVLNDTAATVWDLLAEDCSVGELAAAVSKKFDVTRDRALADVAGFLNEIAAMGLLQA